MKMIKKTIAFTLGLVMMGGAASFAQSLADAKKAIDAEQYQKATSMLKTLVNSDPKEGEIYFNLGNVYLINEDVDSARVIYTKGITAAPKNALNYIGLGHADLITNNAAAAKANFDKAIDLGKKDYETYLYIGRAYFEQPKPDYAAALPNLQKADELDSKDKDVETFLALADFYAIQSDNNKAYPQYLRALDINPTLHRANVQIGRMFKQAQGFIEAEAQEKKVIEADPNYGPAYRELAEVQMQWADFDPKNGPAKRTEALANMRKYLDLTDKSFDSRYRYVQFLFYAGDFQTLGTELATLKADPNNPKMFIVNRLQGYSAVEAKNYAEGVKYLSSLFAKKEDASRIVGTDYLYLGRAYQGIGNDSLALLNVTKGVELDTTKVEELADIAKKLYAAKAYDKAIPTFKKVISLNSTNPNMAMNNFYLALAMYVKSGAKDRGLLVEADSAFAKVTRLAPDYEKAFLYRARVNKAIDVLDNPETQKGLSVPFYEKFIELVTVTNPDKAAANAKDLVDTYNYLGFLISGTDKEKAKEYFNKALAIDPQNAYAGDNLKALNAPPAPVKKAPIKK
ncbi:MAG: tetratricopeptide repeat protein [Bacteroidota bacterium]